ncbi:WD40-repeat-containing domain protein [Lenzites betulinus]|nr:WD40-repeat-containing domain protein [Lenzites betulinus]
MRYRREHKLSGHQTGGISQVSFSPNSTLLATADLEGKMCIWEVSSGTLLYSYQAAAPILSITWPADLEFVCGLGDGTIATATVDTENGELKVHGKWCHAYPVEHLSYNRKYLASGAHREVFLWRNRDVLSDPAEEIDPPAQGTEEVLVTGIQWLDQAGSNKVDFLVISYMFQGVRVIETETWNVVRTIGETQFVSGISLSPDGGLIAISTLSSGFDIHDFVAGTRLVTVPDEHDSSKSVIPVLFAHGGHAIITGSSTGSANVWYIDRTQCRKLQSLRLADEGSVQALAACYDAKSDLFLIAAGLTSSSETDLSVVIVWKAEEERKTGSTSDSGLKNTSQSLKIWALVITLAMAICAFALRVSISGLEEMAVNWHL